jgi:hypothetical protein
MASEVKDMVEFFSAECRLCDAALSTLLGRFPTLKLTIHRASDCVDGSCCRLAEAYGVRAIPALVVDGAVVFLGVPGEEDLQRLAPLLAPAREA